ILPTPRPAPSATPQRAPQPAGTIAAQDKELKLFWEAMTLLQDGFYGDVPSGQNLQYAAIRGVVSSLDDRFTSFMTADEAQRFEDSLDGSFEGIGAQVDKTEDDKGARIVEVYPGFPAATAGVRRNDIITAVDGQDIGPLSLTEIISHIRGPRGTTVILTIRREGEDAPLEISVTRARIEIPVVESKMLAGNIGYVKLQEFSRPAPERLKTALKELLDQEPVGLILDLRGNPGGLLDVAVEVGSQFVAAGDILIERKKDGSEEHFSVRTGGLAIGVPLAVLVNEGSASASEIVAGAIQDAGRGPLVGTKTFGKGSVQLPQTLSDGSMLRVTIAHWFTPKGRGIHGTGLEPDIPIELSEQDRSAGRDPQLDRAVEYLSAQ
ncbi:MAG: S41 family peptidase, partial [Anaerolineae bacterium]